MTINRQTIKLESKRRTDVLDALYTMGSDYDTPPSGQCLEALIKLLSHRDADIREQAINVAAIHWRLDEAYQALIEAIQTEKDQTVLIAICAALGSLVQRGKGNPHKVSSLLAPIILNEELDPELRGTAYLALMRIHNKVSTKEYAASTPDLEKMQVDFAWVNTMLSA